MKILCLTSWIPSGRWLWDYIPGNTDQVDFVYITHPKDRFPGYGKLLGYYEKFFFLAFKAFRRMNNYDVIVTWEGNTGLPLALMRTLLRRRQQPMVILNFVLKGKPVWDALPLVRLALRSVNLMTCISNQEIAYYSDILKLQPARFTRLQGPWPDQQRGVSISEPPSDYIIAAGRSHRDYGTLMEAVREIPVRLLINAREFNVKGLIPPPNVTVNSFMPFDEFANLLRHSKFAILPLHEAKHASGESFLAQAITMERAVIATRTYSMSEMIDDGVTGILVPPADAQAMRNAIQYLLEHPEVAHKMGKLARSQYLARWSFPVIARQVDNILQQVAMK